MISAFADDGVVYVELRTTPRAEVSSGMTKVLWSSATIVPSLESRVNYLTKK